MRDNVWEDKERKMLRVAQGEGREHGLEVEAVQMRSNGAGAVRFYAVLFRDRADVGRRMVATLFSEPGHTAILDAAEAAAGNIGRGNKGPADSYDRALRRVVAAWHNAENEYWTRTKAARSLRVRQPGSRWSASMRSRAGP